MRYSGSKTWLVKYLAPVIERNLIPGGTYVEPFVGGANMFSCIDVPRKIGADTNKYVISMWKALQAGIFTPPMEVSKEEYYRVKDDWKYKTGHYSDAYIGYVGMSCSNSSAWFNGPALYNAKRGEDHVKEAYENLTKQVGGFLHFNSAEFLHLSYDRLEIADGSVVYCDPPYRGTKGYANTFDSDAFWEWAREIAKTTVLFASEITAPKDFTPIMKFSKKVRVGTSSIDRVEYVYALKSQVGKLK